MPTTCLGTKRDQTHCGDMTNHVEIVLSGQTVYIKYVLNEQNALQCLIECLSSFKQSIETAKYYDKKQSLIVLDLQTFAV